MTLKPCLTCGKPTPDTRCDEHQLPDTKPNAAARGYDQRWRTLSERARRRQPWCTDCGATEDLQADHLPEAWARKAAGKPIRLRDIAIRCGPCNRAAGPARGNALTRGYAPPQHLPDPIGKAQGALHTPGGYA